MRTALVLLASCFLVPGRLPASPPAAAASQGAQPGTTTVVKSSVTTTVQPSPDAAKYFVKPIVLPSSSSDAGLAFDPISPIPPIIVKPPANVPVTVQIRTNEPSEVTLSAAPKNAAEVIAPSAMPTKSDSGHGYKYTATFTVKVTGSGTIKLTAVQGGKSSTQDFEASYERECRPSLLPPAGTASPKNPFPDATTVAGMLGNPQPFSLVAAGKDKLLVYSSRWPLKAEDAQTLKQIETTAKQLRNLTAEEVPAAPSASATAAAPASGSASTSSAAGSKPAYSVRLQVPHAATLGDPATLFSSLGYSDFTVQKLDSAHIRITSTKTPDCKELTSFLDGIRRLAWGLPAYPQSPVYKLFILDASDVLPAIKGTGTTAGGGSQGGANQGSGGQGGGNQGSGSQGASSQAGSNQGAGGAASPSGGNQSPGAGQAGSAPAASASANGATATASSGATTTPASANTTAASTATPGGSSQASSNAVSANAVGFDQLVFSTSIGNDSGIGEQRRILTLLDLPRPEVLITALSVQISSADSNSVKKANVGIRQEVNNFNDALDKAVYRGWSCLKRKLSAEDNLPPEASNLASGYKSYVSGLFVGGNDAPTDHQNYEEAAQALVSNRWPAQIPDEIRQKFGICANNQYCLGYRSLFKPLKPRLTDLLLVAVAFQKPAAITDECIDEMENVTAKSFPQDLTCDAKDAFQDDKRPDDPENPLTQHKAPPFYLECFREKAAELFGTTAGLQSQAGLLRAAVADFLFNYKMSQQFPHEFSPYGVREGAQTLNSALNPLVVAFNRDVANFQTRLLQKITDREIRKKSWFGAEKATFASSGLITVRTISGQDTQVNTTTQNFLDATQMPAFSDLLSSIEGAKAPAPAGSHMTNVLQNMSPVQAQVLLGTAAAIQSSKVQIGRGLMIDVTPRSLSGASAAEIQVTMKADESASPTYFSGPQSGKAADISRVATHDTQTRVRVDSIKLFDVSTLTAEVQKSRSRFPLVPPLIEIPYLGSLLGVPLPPAKEYHSSVAILAAIVVPTATDLATDLYFENDKLLDASSEQGCGTENEPCRTRSAASFSDLRYFPIRDFHRAMLVCLAENGDKPCNKTFKDLVVRGAQ
jgi:hypothetical protein